MSVGVTVSTDVRPKSYPWLSASDMLESLVGVELMSKLSLNAGNMYSALGLPELTNDMSILNCDKSPYDIPFRSFLCGSGDLFPVTNIHYEYRLYSL